MSQTSSKTKILVPVDFSERALAAVAEAAKYQRLTGAEVILLHVEEAVFDGLRIHTGAGHQQEQAAAARKLEEIRQAHFDAGQAVSTLVKDGNAPAVICEMAEKLGVDFIFLSSYGASALKHFLLGGVTDRVVRHAPCSVLVVR